MNPPTINVPLETTMDRNLPIPLTILLPLRLAATTTITTITREEETWTKVTTRGTLKVLNRLATDAQRVTRESSRPRKRSETSWLSSIPWWLTVSLMVLTLDPILAPETLILRTENNRGLNVETSVVIRESSLSHISVSQDRNWRGSDIHRYGNQPGGQGYGGESSFGDDNERNTRSGGLSGSGRDSSDRGGQFGDNDTRGQFSSSSDRNESYVHALFSTVSMIRWLWPKYRCSYSSYKSGGDDFSTGSAAGGGDSYGDGVNSFGGADSREDNFASRGSDNERQNRQGQFGSGNDNESSWVVSQSQPLLCTLELTRHSHRSYGQSSSNYDSSNRDTSDYNSSSTRDTSDYNSSSNRDSNDYWSLNSLNIR